jgi:hypothetical protein
MSGLWKCRRVPFPMVLLDFICWEIFVESPIENNGRWCIIKCLCRYENKDSLLLEVIQDIYIYFIYKETLTHYFAFLTLFFLQLDPLMWTSYEALCELGDVDIDPTSVFGVRPTELDQVHQHLHKPQNMPLQEKNVLQSSFFSHAQRSPMEAVRKLQPMDLGTPSSTGSSIPKTTLFQTAPKRSTSKGTTLQFDTPNLTPIPMQSQDASFAVNPPDTTSSFAADSTNPNTIRRAQNVAARLYYQLSPETPDSAHQAPSSRYLRGMDRSSSLLFGDVEGTPLRRGGRQDNSDIHHQPSTARKPRALFMMSENKNINNPEEDDQPDHADPNEQKQQQQKQQQEDEKPSTTSNVHPEELEDGVDSHQAVQEILENLCMMGAAFWRLCQVCCIQSIFANGLLGTRWSSTPAYPSFQTVSLVSLSRSLAAVPPPSSRPT